jgi:manganese transport protein
MDGQVMMLGFVRFRIPLWLRRAVTIVPSLAIIFSGADPTRSLVVSQVILSLALPFAVVPLVIFTSRRAIMGELVNRRLTTVAAAVVAGLVIALNLLLLAYLALGS